MGCRLQQQKQPKIKAKIISTYLNCSDTQKLLKRSKDDYKEPLFWQYTCKDTGQDKSERKTEMTVARGRRVSEAEPNRKEVRIEVGSRMQCTAEQDRGGDRAEQDRGGMEAAE